MRNKLLLAAVTLMTCQAVRPAQADIISGHKISMKGTITQMIAAGGVTSVKPLTIKSLLAVEGLTTTDSKTVQYYYDSDGPSYVIAPKANGGGNAPISTIFNFDGGGYITWEPTSHSIVAAGKATGVDGDLSGIYSQNGVSGRKTATDRTAFTFYGVINNIETIMKGTIVDTFSLKQ